MSHLPVAWDDEKIAQMLRHAEDFDTGSCELREAIDEIMRLRSTIPPPEICARND